MMARHDNSTKADRAFAEYRRTGSPDALAELFDETAPSLLLLLAHFTSDAAMAEDLVQVTFVQVIESASGFDGSRPVLPWLMSIVGNRARDLMRHEKLRVHHKLSNEFVDDRPGPLAITASRDGCDRISKAIASLSEIYRQILVYHLLHGLQPIEIAHAQGMSPATVRTQLRRGLQLLRKALPTSVVLPSCVLLLSGGRLAAIRDGVLATLPSRTMAPTAATMSGKLILGVAAMKKMFIAGIATLAVGLTIAWSTLGGSEEGVGTAGAEELGRDIAASIEARKVAEGDRLSMSQATVEPTGEAERTKIATSETPDHTTLRGRCVDGDGVPVSGVKISLHGQPGTEWRKTQYLKSHGEIEWTDPEPQMTTGVGQFSFRFNPPPPFAFTLSVAPSEFVPMRRDWQEFPSGATIDVGDIQLIRGCRISGKIIDADGATLSGVDWSIKTERSHTGASGFATVRMSGGRTKPNGTFQLRRMLMNGKWIPRVRGREIETPKVIELRPNHTDMAIDIVVKGHIAAREIRGVIVDDAGRPVSRASIDVRPRSTGWMGRSKPDGSFRIVRGERDPNRPVRISIRRRGFEPLRMVRDISWGTLDLRLVMTRASLVTIRVTEAAAGRPVERFGVRMIEKPGTFHRPSLRVSRIEHRGHHPSGEVSFRLPAATYMLCVVPEERSLHASGFVSFVVQTGDSPSIAVALHPGAARKLRVVDARGKPVRDTKVELMQPLGTAPVNLDTFPVRFDGSSTSSHNKAVTWHEGSTDAAGEIQLEGPARTPMTLRLTGRHQPKIVTAVHLDDPKPILVEVVAGATVFGRVQPKRFLDQMRTIAGKHAWAQPGFKLVRVLPDGKRELLPASALERFPLAADGTFEIPGLSPGLWELILGFENRTIRLDTLDGLRDGERRELNFELGHLIMTKVRGTVLLNGKPMARGTVGFKGVVVHKGSSQYAGADGQVPWKGKDGGAGRFEILSFPGRVDVTVYFRDDDGDSVSLMADGSISVQPGQILETTVHVRFARVRFRVVGSDGKPRTGVSVRVRRVGQDHDRYLRATDVEGFAAGAVPAGRVEVWVPAKRDPRVPGTVVRVGLGSFEFAAGDRKGVVELSLPERAGY